MLFQVCTQNTIVIVSFEGNDKATVGLNPCLNKRQITQHTKKDTHIAHIAFVMTPYMRAFASDSVLHMLLQNKNLTAMPITIALVKKKKEIEGAKFFIST